MAELSLEAVVVSKNPAWKTKTEQATIKICTAILEAHEKVSNPHLAQQAKKDAVLKVLGLTPELEWLAEFTKAETDAYHSSEEQKKKMATIANNINTQVSKLNTSFQSCSNSNSLDEKGFNAIFPSLLKVLEEVTDFFKESHAAEILRVIETCDDTATQIKNLYNIDAPAMLVPQAKLLKLRAEEGKTYVLYLGWPFFFSSKLSMILRILFNDFDCRCFRFNSLGMLRIFCLFKKQKISH
jgi:hypothetical protein